MSFMAGTMWQDEFRGDVVRARLSLFSLFFCCSVVEAYLSAAVVGVSAEEPETFRGAAFFNEQAGGISGTASGTADDEHRAFRDFGGSVEKFVHRDEEGARGVACGKFPWGTHIEKREPSIGKFRYESVALLGRKGAA